ncbi:MAG: carbohydrate binding domain-containing protein [Gammaproteobacteria bacterium]|nr:carbohydrate binding domain-containing protein [Gammaproteobacteria bacterium]
MSVACSAMTPFRGMSPPSSVRPFLPLLLCFSYGCLAADVFAQDEEDQEVTGNTFGIQAPISDLDGHPTFASPHFNPLAIHGDLVYVVNTPADTLDVIDPTSDSVVFRINVGIDPVSVVSRPNADEVWVSNHVSDTISVIDTDPESAFYHQIVATIQDVDRFSFSTNFDEPVGIAFTQDGKKAYVALGPSNQVAVIDAETRVVTKHLKINAQDPRALVVRGTRLYVTAFESGNTTQLSGCNPGQIDGSMCTYDAVQHTHTTNNVLSLGIDVDIVRNPKVPDRDLFVFDTRSDRLVDQVEGTGTLLYGLAVDGRRNVYIAQAEARNDANGLAGTQDHGLAEMENRAFLNQITRVNCSDRNCDDPEIFELEPLPPEHPDTGAALATPFAVEITKDNTTLIGTAAGSNKLFVFDVESGSVTGRVDVGAVPRGVKLVYDEGDGLSEAWVMNAVSNTITRVDLSTLSEPSIMATIKLEDPTPDQMKLGRIAFNDANASTTGTFSCDSCHPDNNVDQLVWVLDTPPCDQSHPGCTQIPPRLTMPVRGLRDTQPYHWDGIPGDPYGGINVQSLWDPVEPNCELDDPESCTRFLVDGSLGTTMCDVTDCPTNEEDKGGALDIEERDALAHYILNVPFPPAPNRPFDNELSASAKEGIFEFNFLNDSGTDTGAQTCGACHKPPFLTTTNTPSAQNVNAGVGSFNGMDAPTWRGAYDRWIVTPQARFNVIDLIERIGMDLGADIPEQEVWFHAGARTQANWDMVLEYSTGFSGTFARQATFNSSLADDSVHTDMTDRIAATLIAAADNGAVLLHADGLYIDHDGDVEASADSGLDDDSTGDTTSEHVFGLALEYVDGEWRDRSDSDITYELVDLRDQAVAGDLVLTFTGRIGQNVLPDQPQPAIWPFWNRFGNLYDGVVQQSPTVEITYLTDDLTLTLKGRHIEDDALIFINGHAVSGTVTCVNEMLPSCEDERIVVTLDEAPVRYGLNFLQIQNEDGMISNDVMFFSQEVDKTARAGNLIVSGGTFDRFIFPLQEFWNTVESQGNNVWIDNGFINVSIARVNTGEPWRAQISHHVSIDEDQEYSVCFRAKANSARSIDVYVDQSMHEWQRLFTENVDLRNYWQNFKHTFTADRTDITARVAFDLAGASPSVQLDNIGLYEGDTCGTPDVTTPVGFHSSQ